MTKTYVKLIGKTLLACTAVGAMVIGNIMDIKKIIAWLEESDK